MLESVSECRKCGKVVSFKEYEKSRFCPDCGTFLLHPRRPKCWIFQFNPAMYRWFDWIEEKRDWEQWLVSQHAREIHKRDKAAIWASGEKAGFYAIGEVETDPSRKPLNKEQEKYWVNSLDVYKFEEKSSVIIRYVKLFVDSPLLAKECLRDPLLRGMEILKQPQGTNFPLTIEQWNRILELINNKD
ncbi:EVE domain-containing protein [Candidatus Bathyarchaeota archaeon]|nr:EVE domain-containing protein [Candidatus Bathyarchaeota archaeon]